MTIKQRTQSRDSADASVSAEHESDAYATCAPSLHSVVPHYRTSAGCNSHSASTILTHYKKHLSYILDNEFIFAISTLLHQFLATGQSMFL